jgi:hypothetical protein
VSSVEEDGGGSEVDSSKEAAGELVIAGRDAPKVFELVKEALHEIALLVEHVIAWAGALPVPLGRDDGLHTGPHERVDEGVGIKRLVGDDRQRVSLGQEIRRWDEVVGLPWGDGECDWVAQRIHQSMDLGGQTTTGASDGLVLAPFLRAPALC